MFKHIDDVTDEKLEGFVYENKYGEKEYVIVDGSAAVQIKDANDCTCLIYTQDIPMLIKALQAAYNHKVQ